MKKYAITISNHNDGRLALSEHYTEDNPVYVLINDKTGVAHCSDEYETIPLVMKMYIEDNEPFTLYQRTKVVAKIANDENGDLTKKALYVRDNLHYILYTTFRRACTTNPRYSATPCYTYGIRESVKFDLNGEEFDVNVSGDSVSALVDDCVRAVKRRFRDNELAMYTNGLYAMISTCEGIQETIERDPEGLFDEETRNTTYDALIDVIDALTDITTTLEEGYKGCY